MIGELPKCTGCGLSVDGDNLWYSSFCTRDDEVTKWTCPSCGQINYTAAIVTTMFETSDYNEWTDQGEEDGQWPNDKEG